LILFTVQEKTLLALTIVDDLAGVMMGDIHMYQ